MGETEKRSAEQGHEALTGKKAEFDEDITKNTNLFKDTVSSWWNKTKSIFSRSKNRGGEEEVIALEKKAEALKADYQKKAEAAVAPESQPDNVIDLQAERAKREVIAAEASREIPATAGPEAPPADEARAQMGARVDKAMASEDALDEAFAAGEEQLNREIAAAGGLETWKLRQKAAELSAEYDRLAEEVAKEGASEKKVQKWALKEELNIGPTSEAGVRLNQVYAELNRVRAELAKPKPAAPDARAERIEAMGKRVDAAMAAEDEKAAMEAVASLEKDAAAEKMAERQRQWDADKAEHERQRNEKLAARDAAAEEAGVESQEDRELVLERSRAKAESLLRTQDPRFSVSIEDLRVTPKDSARAPYSVRALRISHPEEARMNWTQEVAEDPAEAEMRLEQALTKAYAEKLAAQEPAPDPEPSPMPKKKKGKPEAPKPQPAVQEAPVAEASVPEVPAEKPADPYAAFVQGALPEVLKNLGVSSRAIKTPGAFRDALTQTKGLESMSKEPDDRLTKLYLAYREATKKKKKP